MLIKIIFGGAIFILNPTSIWAKETPALICFNVMSLGPAQKFTKATLNDYRENDPRIAFSAACRSGNLQTILRNGFYGGHKHETVQHKAWAAFRFCSDTPTRTKETKSGTAAPGVRFIPQALILGGAVPVQSGGLIVGAIGATGAPRGFRDDECARVGIDSIRNSLEF